VESTVDAMVVFPVAHFLTMPSPTHQKLHMWLTLKVSHYYIIKLNMPYLESTVDAVVVFPVAHFLTVDPTALPATVISGDKKHARKQIFYLFEISVDSNVSDLILFFIQVI